MLILEIALGVVLGVFILKHWDKIAAVIGATLLVGVTALCLLIWNPPMSVLAEFGVIALIITVLYLYGKWYSRRPFKA